MKVSITISALLALSVAFLESTPSYGSPTFRGQLVLGHEVRSFRPCGEEVEYWVVDHTGGDIWKVYRKLTHRPYQPMYVEVRGQLGPPSSEGFGADYDRQLTISELRRAGIETRGCDEDLRGIAFRASGNEPFWDVQISESGITFSELGKSKRLFPYARPTVSRSGWLYASKAEEPAQHSIQISITENRCLDSMSGEHFSFEALVGLDGRKYLGCARAGLLNPLEPHSDAPGPLTIEDLKNAEYQSGFSVNGKVKLTNGIFKGEMAPNSATQLVVMLSEKVVFDDLNGDGEIDAAVVLITDPGGTGTFRHLGVVINQNGFPRHVASQLLGDRVEVKSLSIRSGEIAAEMITHGPNDPMCCPTLKVTQNYLLQGTRLVIAGMLELTSRKWALQSFGVAGSEDALVPNTRVSLEFAEDGRLHGSGGCNRYFSAYEIGPGDSLTIKHIGSTRMACPQDVMDQETRYFEALQAVSAFKVEEDLLQLFYEDHQRVLRFIPAQSK